MFGTFFKKKKQEEDEPPRYFIVAQLNAKVQPIDRGDLFEDPLDEVLQSASLGEVTGGGTQLNEEREITHCDIEIQVSQPTDETIQTIVKTLEGLGVPKGSVLKIEYENRELPFGVNEGLALYLNGTELADEVYANHDSNFVYSELERLTEGCGRLLGYWNGPRDTALYLYGPSFAEMHARIKDFIDTYPLCEKCRVEQIA